MRIRLLSLLLALPALGITGLVSEPNALAQYYGQPPPPPPPPPMGPHRMGFTIGFAIGGGSFAFSCNAGESCPSASGPALELHLGGMLAPNLALEFDGSTVIHFFDNSSGNGSISSDFAALAVQFWPIRFLWLKGGVGLAQLSVQDAAGFTINNSETGFGLLGAGGVELISSPRFALDLQLRLTTAHYSDANTINAALMLGFNWY
jgi:hypothetical protein